MSLATLGPLWWSPGPSVVPSQLRKIADELPLRWTLSCEILSIALKSYTFGHSFSETQTSIYRVGTLWDQS
jgi:hypothetical protein